MAMLRALALALSKMGAIRVQRPEQTYDVPFGYGVENRPGRSRGTSEVAVA